MNKKEWQITNATVVIPGEIRKASGCLISDGRIQRILEPGESDGDLLNLNLHGLPLYPGLINGHDSLLATYDSCRGDNWPYLNWLAWDNEVKSSSTFKERMLLEPRELYLLGAYRNLLSGVTTVVDHIPSFVRAPFQDSLPVSLLKDYGIAHSLCSYSLQWGESLEKELERAHQKDLPFITHIAEGFDQESKLSLSLLEKAGGLDDHAVLVHGLSLSPSDLDRIARAESHMVWCPRANLFLYEATPPVQEALEKRISLSLGTDSAMSGSLHLLDELNTAMRILSREGKDPLNPELLFSMVTTNPARAFRLNDRGEIAEGLRADLMVLRGKYPSRPHHSLVQAELPEVYLVVKEGLPVYGEETLSVIFDEMGVEYERVQVMGAEKIIQKGLKKLLVSITEAVGYFKTFEFLPVSFSDH